MLDKFLDKIPTDKIYDQLLQPSFKNVGEALGTLFSLGNLVLLPLKLQDQKAKLRFDANLKRYAQKLEKSLEEEICEVPPYVGLPIVEKLSYLDQHELSEAFINLLTKASTKGTVNLAHPSFIMALNNLCADEAKILFHYKNAESIPRLDLYTQKLDVNDIKPLASGSKIDPKVIWNTFTPIEQVHNRIAWNLTGIEAVVKLDFPENIDVYIENLEKLGIVALEKESVLKKDLEKFEHLEHQVYKRNIAETEQWIAKLNQEHPDIEHRLYNKKSYYYFTEYGKMFLKACIKEIGEAEADKV